MSLTATREATFGGPHQFRQVVEFADQCAAERRPFADADDASERLRWSSGPAGIRASLKLDEAQRAAYRARQVEQACEAVAVYMADNFDPDDFDIYAEESLIDGAALVAAGATHASDGELSTLIRSADIADIIATHFPITDRENAEWLAERALIDIHVPFREPTAEEKLEVREEVAFVEAWCAAPDVLATIHPTADLAEALQERFTDLTAHDAQRAAEHALRITVEPIDADAAEDAAPAGLDLTSPNSWDNPENMPPTVRPIASLASLDLASLANVDPTPKSFAIERIAPAGEVTLFTGPGSAGKSLLGQQFATAAASGKSCIGLTVQSGAAIYLTCEDDADQLHWRQQHLCKALSVPMASLADRLHLISLRGELDNALMVEQAKGAVAPSAAYQRIAATIEATGAHVIFLDNVAHLFVGNENDRGEVTRFVNLLNRLAGETGAAIVLLAHTNKAGDNFSGSTAWLNAVRSQCFITHDEETDLRTLSLPKSNYDRKGDVATFRWHDWAFVRDADMPVDQRAEIAQAIAANAADAAFLACLRVRNAQGEGRGVGPSPGANYAPTQFEGMPEAKRYRRQVLKQAMDRLFAAGKIRTETIRNQTKGRDVTVIVEVVEAA